MCWAVTSTWGSAASTLKDEDSLNLGTLLGILLDHLNIAGTLRALLKLEPGWKVTQIWPEPCWSHASWNLAGTSLEPCWRVVRLEVWLETLLEPI